MNTSIILLILLKFAVSQGPKLSDSELQSLFDELFQADVSGNRAKEGQVVINPQQRTGIRDRIDKAPKSYFEYVDESVLERPTYKALISLYDDYNPNTGVVDTVTNEKKEDIEQFLDSVIKTEVFQIMRQFLAKKGLQGSSSDGQFKDLLHKVWFAPYSRARGVDDTSAFEHVFMGEFKKGETHGLHNWVRVYWLEKQGNIDYTGHLFKNDQLAQIQFKYDDFWKSGGSFFLRSSPEFDFSIYTLCFLAKPGQKACKFQLFDCTKVLVTTHTNEQNGKKYLGTAYPQSEKKDGSCSPKPLPKASSKPKPAPEPQKPDPVNPKEDEWPTLPPVIDPEPEVTTKPPYVPYKPKFKVVDPDVDNTKDSKDERGFTKQACAVLPQIFLLGICIIISAISIGRRG